MKMKLKWCKICLTLLFSSCSIYKEEYSEVLYEPATVITAAYSPSRHNLTLMPVYNITYSKMDLVLVPSKIYSRAVVSMHGGFKTKGSCKINGVSHITGGGVPGKLGRVLRASGFGADLDNLFEPCKIMKYCQKVGNVDAKEAYRTWNMGQGLLVISPEPEKVILEAKKFGIDAQICGKVVKKKGIRILSRGVGGEKELIFE